MPHLMIAVLVVGVAGAYAGYRYIQRQRVRQAEAAEAAKRAAGPNDRGKLEWDAASKSYKPRQD